MAGMTSRNAAPQIKFLRPKRSEITPISGAMAAVAINGAVMVNPVRASLT